jgi:hypothetical protein
MTLLSSRRSAAADSEAHVVRCIFRRYAELGSVRLVKDDLDA